MNIIAFNIQQLYFDQYVEVSLYCYFVEGDNLYPIPNFKGGFIKLEERGGETENDTKVKGHNQIKPNHNLLL